MNTTTPVHLTACTIINQTGIHTLQGSASWERDQDGPTAIRRSQVLTSPYMAFGKLNIPDKLAFSAASLTLRACRVTNPDTTGIFLGIPTGSTSTDYLYRQSIEAGAPSPALFSATLPSSPVTDIAIFYRLKGPDMVFSGGTSPLFSAIESAQQALLERDVSGALVILVEEMTGKSHTPSSPSPFAAAFYLSSEITPGVPAPTFTYQHMADKTMGQAPLDFDRTFMVTLLEKLRGTTTEQLTVPVSGFKGYISLQYPGKDS